MLQDNRAKPNQGDKLYLLYESMYIQKIETSIKAWLGHKYEK